MYPKALLAIASSRSILMAGAFIVQQRTANSGSVDTIFAFAVSLVGVGSALWPIAGEAALHDNGCDLVNRAVAG